jgi:hypothetical protein
MRDSIHHHCESKEPHREEGRSVSSAYPNRPEDPRDEPQEVKNEEECKRPGRQTEQAWEAIAKMSRVLFKEMKKFQWNTHGCGHAGRAPKVG